MATSILPAMTSKMPFAIALSLAAAGSITGCATGHAPATPISPDLADQLAIRTLIERASDAINHHEWSRLEPMFTDDIVWEALPPVGWKLEGLEAIRGFFKTNEGKVEVLSYSVAATRIELDGNDRATARSTMTELLHLKEAGTGMQLVGTYTDDLVKQRGQWRFARRRFQLRFEDDVALPDRLGATHSVVPGAPASAR